MPLTMDQGTHGKSAPAGPPSSRAIVVGASSGLGAEIVRELVRRGTRVAALARREEELEKLRAEAPERVLTRVHDVHRVAEAPALFEELVRALGGLDLLVYAAGVMPRLGPLEFDTEVDAETLAVNVLGAVAWCNPAAEHFQAKRSGAIVGLSSIAGDRGRKKNTVYGASKAALSHYLESLRNRLSDHGVRVCTIKPGPVATPMTAGLTDLPGMIWAQDATRIIVDYAQHGGGVRYVPLKWLGVSLVIRAIPSFVFRRLTI